MTSSKESTGAEENLRYTAVGDDTRVRAPRDASIILDSPWLSKDYRLKGGDQLRGCVQRSRTWPYAQFTEQSNETCARYCSKFVWIALKVAIEKIVGAQTIITWRKTESKIRSIGRSTSKDEKETLSSPFFMEYLLATYSSVTSRTRTSYCRQVPRPPG